MFFVRNNSEIKQPYRIEEIQKDSQSDQDHSQQQFQDEEKKKLKKFIKASKNIYNKKIVVLAHEIMSHQFITLRENLTPKEAWEKIKGYTVQYFPILSIEGKLIGILSENEILEEKKLKSTKTLRDMTAKMTLCGEPDSEIKEMIEVFLMKNLDVLPIVDKKDHVIGIVTQNDLFQIMTKVSELEEKKFFT